jgi:hypothetical protein
MMGDQAGLSIADVLRAACSLFTFLTPIARKDQWYDWSFLKPSGTLPFDAEWLAQTSSRPSHPEATDKAAKEQGRDNQAQVHGTLF